MSITSENSVLVIGAGTSAPFGLSLGGDLISEISNTIGREKRIFDGKFSGRIGIGSRAAFHYFFAHENFRECPILNTIVHPYMNFELDQIEVNVQDHLDKLWHLVELLNNQTSETIDDFIVENPTYAAVVKKCVSTLFFLACVDSNHTLRAKSFEARYLGNQNRNWVHLLINIVRQGIRAGEVSAENKIKIITFNYDMILEYVLEKQFSNTERRMAHWSDYIEILHVHGQCGSLSELNERPAKICDEWAKGIHVVNEPNVPDWVQQNRNLASDIIRSSRELYFCGFAFSGPNCRLLELGEPDDWLGERTISFCNYDGNVGLSKAVANYEQIVVPTADPDQISLVSTDIQEAKGTRTEPIGVTDWLRLGYLGELPA